MKNNHKTKQRNADPVPKPKDETPAARYRSLVISYLGILARIEKRSIQKTPEPLLDSLGVSLSDDKMHCTTVSVKVPQDLGNEDVKRRISELEAFLSRHQDQLPLQGGSRRGRRSFSNLWPIQRKTQEAKRKATETAEEAPFEETASDLQ